MLIIQEGTALLSMTHIVVNVFSNNILLQPNIHFFSGKKQICVELNVFKKPQKHPSWMAPT